MEVQYTWVLVPTKNLITISQQKSISILTQHHSLNSITTSNQSSKTFILMVDLLREVLRLLSKVLGSSSSPSMESCPIVKLEIQSQKDSLSQLWESYVQLLLEIASIQDCLYWSLKMELITLIQEDSSTIINTQNSMESPFLQDLQQEELQ